MEQRRYQGSGPEASYFEENHFGSAKSLFWVGKLLRQHKDFFTHTINNVNISGGSRRRDGCVSPLWPKISQISQVIGWRPLRGWCRPLGNPGSATEYLGLILEAQKAFQHHTNHDVDAETKRMRSVSEATLSCKLRDIKFN